MSKKQRKSRVVSARLYFGDDEARTSREQEALEIFERWEAKDYTMREIIITALLHLGDKPPKSESELAQQLSGLIDEANSLIEKLSTGGIQAQPIREEREQPQTEKPPLSPALLASLKARTQGRSSE